MKRQLIVILSVVMIIIFGVILTVNAAGASVTLRSDKSEVEPGDTFTIVLSASCEDGINGLDGYLSYDINQLELVSKGSVDTEKWSLIPGEESEGKFEIPIMSNTSSKSGDIFKVTFKVKDSVERGTTIKVTPEDIMLDSFAETDSEHKDTGANVVSVKVKELPKQENTEPENKVPENKTEYKTIENKNATQSQAKKMPYTGTNMFVIISVVAVGTIAIVSYVSYKRYKNI